MSEVKHTSDELKRLQQLSLDDKLGLSMTRIAEFWARYNGNVCVSYSGGKDSTVLLDIVRRVFPEVRAVFSNTGLEYPEIQRFVRNTPNTAIIRPKMQFPEVLSTYGYPLISKEVAEAIYYARRITGGGKQTVRKRSELSGELLHGKQQTENAENCLMPSEMGGGNLKDRPCSPACMRRVTQRFMTEADLTRANTFRCVRRLRF